MKLPRLYRPINIKFSSLRAGLGGNLGVVFDIDTMVEREAMRVRTEGGWKWQIKNLSATLEWDWCVETDQEILDEIGMDLAGIGYT
ncbi:MAG: hypothetical protein GY938_27330 [Ketobacter sp.]|nr:hypothetical protein [Ketobacter sp.]